MSKSVDARHTYTLATREYLRSLTKQFGQEIRGLTWEPTKPQQRPPKHLKVTRCIEIKARAYPHGDQALVDWFVCYEDWTADPRSLTPSMGRPVIGEYFSRTEAWVGGDFATWVPTDEELRRLP